MHPEVRRTLGVAELAELLEPGALEPLPGSTPRIVITTVEVQTSMAISLKRIAEAVEYIAQYGAGPS